MRKKKKLFCVEPYGDWAKSAEIVGPLSIRMRYDLDDVGYDAEFALPLIVEILNAGWTPELQKKVDAYVKKRNKEEYEDE